MHTDVVALALLSLPRIGRKTAWKLWAEIGPLITPAHSAEEAAREIESRCELVGLTEAIHKATWTILEAEKIGVRCLGPDDLPPQLRSIPDPPFVMFAKGNVAPLWAQPAIAVVGTRDPTAYGERCAHIMAQRIAEAGVMVVSGLAKGCDAAAHLGCLEAGGVTVAVLAHGLDRVYPKENEPLADAILAQGGCLMSEYAPGTRAQRSYFVERDRLQSALSSGVIVIETTIDGGTMHTVGFAEEQGRFVACLAPNIPGDELPDGNAMLLDMGRALPLRDRDDLQGLIDRVTHSGAVASAPPAAAVRARDKWA